MNDRQIPIWPETTVELLSSTLIKYRVTASPERVAQFYCTEMPRCGWSVCGRPLIERERAVLSFSQAGRVVNCIIERDAQQRTRVILALERVWSAPLEREVNGETGLVPSGM